MTDLLKKNLFLLLIVLGVLLFFHKSIISGLLPIPSDTIVGLYHPFRDIYAKEYPRGVPFKNFLITDPVRQIIPWKELSIASLSGIELPLWNPYEMAGKPHLANFQSSAFYPFNVLLFVKPFEISWTLFIILQPILAGIFMFAYLKNLKVDSRAALFGAAPFAFGGFSIAWLEWGNIIHTALWLPLILLSIDKSVSSIQTRVFSIWNFVLVFSLVSSFFAGHLQIFFYVFIFSMAYLIFRWVEYGRNVKLLFLFTINYLLFTVLTFIQWYPTLQLIKLSARTIDQSPLTTTGWFIPWQNLLQFITPDIFGNPATLNYWGVWNYGEFIGYIGIVGLFFAFCAAASKHRREVLFFASAIVVCILFSFPNPIARLPFDLSIPFLSSAQPTRLVYIMTLCLSVLSSFGFNYLISREKGNSRVIIVSALGFVLVFAGLFVVGAGIVNFNINPNDLEVAKRNLIFPIVIFVTGILLMLGVIFSKHARVRAILIIALMVVSFYDLYRFGTKFTPFTNQDYFYPSTKVVEFLQKDKSVFRIASTDSRILPPNFSTYYRIQSIEGYDPLYLRSYAELIAASEREDHSIKPPFGFNRIITPHNIDSPIMDLLNVKYILSLSDLNDLKLVKVFQEGQTRVYENKNVLPRVFFVDQVISSYLESNTTKAMFESDLSKIAFVEYAPQKSILTRGEATVASYSENEIHIEYQNQGDGFLVLSDSYYPTWKVKVDGKATRIYRTNHAMRGVFVPPGRHEVVFYANLF